jgi:hypothetical protein
VYMGQLVVELPFGVDPEMMELEVRISPDEAEVSHIIEFENGINSWGNELEWVLQIDTPHNRPEARTMGSISVRGSIEPEIKSGEENQTIFDFTQTEPLDALLKTAIADKKAQVFDHLSRETTELAVDKRWSRVGYVASVIGGALLAKLMLGTNTAPDGQHPFTNIEALQLGGGMISFMVGSMLGITRGSIARTCRRNITEDTATIQRLDEVASQIEANGIKILSADE